MTDFMNSPGNKGRKYKKLTSEFLNKANLKLYENFDSQLSPPLS